MNRMHLNLQPQNSLAPFAGCFLIAEPSIDDKYFHRAVILLCEYNETSTFGFIVNKPIPISYFNDKKPNLPGSANIFLGGPVDDESFYYLHTRPDLIRDSKVLFENVYVGGQYNDIGEAIKNDTLMPDEIAYFMGYAGWTPGQLEAEISEKAWIVAKGDWQTFITQEKGQLWRESLLSLGPRFAALAHFPEDPSLN